MHERGTLYLSIFSAIILAFMLIYVRADKRNNQFEHKIFKYIIICNICLLIIEILSWQFTRKLGLLNLILNRTFNTLLYVVNPIMGLLWVFFTDYAVFHSKERIKFIFLPIWAIFIVNAAISILSLRTGWFFSISDSNIYVRGDYYMYHMIICYAYLLYTNIFILLHKKMLERRFYRAIILYTIFPALGGIAQALFYGLSIGWSSTCLSILLFYFSIQNKALNTDYLTGAYNRRYLDYYIDQKIRKKNAFSTILIDIDNFKQINDIFGHTIGDDALRSTVKVIKKVLNNTDFIARYGGDEFYIILETEEPAKLKETVDKINNAVNKFNLTGNSPYNLSFSMGYDIYSYNFGKTPEEFLKYIDTLMYSCKNNKQAED